MYCSWTPMVWLIKCKQRVFIKIYLCIVLAINFILLLKIVKAPLKDYFTCIMMMLAEKLQVPYILKASSHQPFNLYAINSMKISLFKMIMSVYEACNRKKKYQTHLPTVNVWDCLTRAIYNREKISATPQDFAAGERNNVPQHLIDNFIRDVPRFFGRLMKEENVFVTLQFIFSKIKKIVSCIF